MTSVRCLAAAAFVAVTSLIVGCAGGSDFPSDLTTDQDLTEPAANKERAAQLDPARIPNERDQRLVAVDQLSDGDPRVGRVAAEVPRMPQPEPGAAEKLIIVPR
jgi:hypothetical protein